MDMQALADRPSDTTTQRYKSARPKMVGSMVGLVGLVMAWGWCPEDGGFSDGLGMVS